MTDEILVTINLPGRLGSKVKHTTWQKYFAKSCDDKGNPIVLHANILHTDTPKVPCAKEVRVGKAIVNHWVTSTAPHWVNAKKWKKMDDTQKIQAYIQIFDEGFGVSFQ